MRTELGKAISYRLKRYGKGWRVFATADMMDVPKDSGVDGTSDSAVAVGEGKDGLELIVGEGDPDVYGLAGAGLAGQARR